MVARFVDRARALAPLLVLLAMGLVVEAGKRWPMP